MNHPVTNDRLGPCAWIIIAEIWPLSVRAKGTALGASASKYLLLLSILSDLDSDVGFQTG
jgi:hypothetical protein